MIEPNVLQREQGIALHYDSLDEIYRRFWGEHVHHGLWFTGKESSDLAVVQLLDFLVAKTGFDPGVKTVDVGCGYGGTSRFLARNFQTQMTAVTLSQAQIDHALSLKEPEDQIDYQKMDWLKNNLPSESFDRVISIESSEHMADKLHFFSEASRVLKQEGKLSIFAWLSKENPTTPEVKYLLEPICREGRLPGLGTKTEYVQWAQANGLSLEGFWDLSQKVKKTWSICISRVNKALVVDQELRRLAFRSGLEDRQFYKTLYRIWIAYQTKSMRYGLFVFKKD